MVLTARLVKKRALPASPLGGFKRKVQKSSMRRQITSPVIILLSVLLLQSLLLASFHEASWGPIGSLLTGDASKAQTALTPQISNRKENENLPNTFTSSVIQNGSFDLIDKPKVYIHIALPNTGSSSIQQAMALDRLILQQDKYFLALPGQDGVDKINDCIIDNMLVLSDTLSACIWSEEERQLIRKQTGTLQTSNCPGYFLPTFDKFLSKAIAAKSNVIISSEWLSRVSSEKGLLKILTDWDPTIVIYYRKFYDWIISTHFQWHLALGIDTVESFEGKVRLVDFIRRVCAPLFNSYVPYSPDDDGFLGFLHQLEVPNYSYDVWKRYKTLPEYDRNNIKIVNYNQGTVVKSMYCDVLGAKKACMLDKERTEVSGKSQESPSKPPNTDYIDLAIGLYWTEKDKMMDIIGESHDGPITMSKFQEWGAIFKRRMDAKGYSEHNLPKDCLTRSEQSTLLDISQAYEKILQSETYSSGGKEALRHDFVKMHINDSFCSVSIDAVKRVSSWKFLLEPSTVSVKN